MYALPNLSCDSLLQDDIYDLHYPFNGPDEVVQTYNIGTLNRISGSFYLDVKAFCGWGIKFSSDGHAIVSNIRMKFEL